MSTDSSPVTNQFIPRLILLAITGVMAAGIMSGTPLQSANDRSRWATVWSLIHRRTWQIDEIDRDPRWSTIDKVRHRTSDDASYHFYSSKPPLLSVITAGVYGAERRLFGVDIKRDTLPVTRYTLLLINGLPMALALLLFQRLLPSLNLSLAAQCFVLLLAGFGSMVNPYLSTLNNHTPAVVCLLICLTTIVKLQQTPEQLRARNFALVGFTAALTACFELPAALFGLVSFVWMLKLNVRKTLLWYLPAALIPLAAYFVTNWLVTGGIRPFYAFYGTEKYIYEHNGVPSYWSHPQGLDANIESTLRYLFHCVCGHHGLLSHTPAFLLSVWGWLQYRRQVVRPGLSWVLPAGAVISAIVLGFYLTRTQNYNYGGNSAALRWMLWLTPFWWFALLDPVESLLRSARGRLISGILLVASILTATVSLPNPWRPSWIYGAMTQAGLINYRTPVAPFDLPRSSVFIDWPETAGTVGTWCLQGSEERITIRSLGSRSLKGHSVCDIEIAHTGSSESIGRTIQCFVLLDEYQAGEPVTNWLRMFDGSSSEIEWLVHLVQGLPISRTYAPSGVRWFQQTPDSHGYRCERAASRVRIDDEQLGQCWYRCDIWYCDEVPFGVLRWKTVVSQETSGELVRIQTWTAKLSD